MFDGAYYEGQRHGREDFEDGWEYDENFRLPNTATALQDAYRRGYADGWELAWNSAEYAYAGSYAY